MNIVFMGTPPFAVPTLKALVESDHKVLAVYTQPPRPAGRGQKESPSPVHLFAQERDIPVYTPVSLKDEETQKQFFAHKADIAVVAAYGLLLPKPILEAYPHGCINVHPSLLPRWRGAAPIQRTIMAGDSKTGICIMQMELGLDTGDVIICRPYDIARGTTASELESQLAAASGDLLLEAMELIAIGYRPHPQSTEGVTYAKKISKEECHIDWAKPAEDIYHHILGLSDRPGAYFIYNNERIKILRADLYDTAHNQQLGTVLNEHLMIACAKGSLVPTLLQRPGKARVDLAEFMHGFSIPPGSILK